MNTSELDIQSAKLEIETFSDRVLRMYTFLPELDNTKNENEYQKIFERTAKYEDITDRMEIEIARFLTKISEGDLSNEGSQKISSMLRIIDNLESIGDSIYQMAILKQNQKTQNVVLDKECRGYLQNASYTCSVLCRQGGDSAHGKNTVHGWGVKLNISTIDNDQPTSQSMKEKSRAVNWLLNYVQFTFLLHNENDLHISE